MPERGHRGGPAAAHGPRPAWRHAARALLAGGLAAAGWPAWAQAAAQTPVRPSAQPGPAASAQALAPPPACGAALPAAGRQQVAGPGGLQLAFSPLPHPVPIGQHFQLAVQVCPGPGQALPRALAVDAQMPAHRHGMNYQPTVHPTAPGLYRVDGLLWHMPGHWRWAFTLDLGDASAPLRLAHDTRL